MNGAARNETAGAIVARLGLSRHPEGGWYRETWRSDQRVNDRALASAILFLLEEGQRSHWHRVDADELWLWHAGSPLALQITGGAGDAASTAILGPDALPGQLPQLRVPARAWQSAEPLSGWTLVSCIVAPAFTFEGFELAPQDWSPAKPNG